MGKSSLSDKSTRKQGLKGTKTALNKTEIHNFDDFDSLSCFKQKKSENIDDKFKLLKSELHLLFHNSKAETSDSLSGGNTHLNQTQDCDKLKKHKNSNTSVSPNPSRFSEWLSETIEKMEVESSNCSINKKLDCDESLPSTTKLGLKSKYNMTLLPNYKVERLLYKSFQLQNLGTYVLSSSDESEPEQLKSRKGIQKKRRSRKASTRSFSSFPKKRKKASLDSDVEIINSKVSLKKNRHKKIDYVDLDVDSFDWNEPFYTKSTTDCSDLEIIEDDQSDINLNKRRQSNNVKVDPKESDFITNAQEQYSSKIFISADTKKTWECPICFEASQGQSIVATMCGHIFCKECLEKHNSTHGKLCPTCRLDLSDKPPITLFNL